jgi:hypothetical protein
MALDGPPPHAQGRPLHGSEMLFAHQKNWEQLIGRTAPKTKTARRCRPRSLSIDGLGPRSPCVDGKLLTGMAALKWQSDRSLQDSCTVCPNHHTCRYHL